MLARVINFRFFFFLFAFICFCRVSNATTILPDSVGVQVVKGNRFVIHQVAAKETLYTIAHRYKLSEKQVISANPQAKNGLQTGSLLYIPRGAAKTQSTAKRPGYTTDKQGNKIYRIMDNETLFSIAQRFKVSTGTLKQWNNLTSDNVKVGQDLIVGVPATKKPTVAVQKTVPVQQQHTEPIAPVTTTAVSTPKNNTQDRDSVLAVQPKPVVYLKESGLAEVINGPNVNKYLALHATAPIGSYITVTNSMNGRQLSVRVIGTLPNTGSNEKIIVKLSRRAQQKLAALDNRFLVDVVYASAE